MNVETMAAMVAALHDAEARGAAAAAARIKELEAVVAGFPARLHAFHSAHRIMADHLEGWRVDHSRCLACDVPWPCAPATHAADLFVYAVRGDDDAPAEMPGDVLAVRPDRKCGTCHGSGLATA